MGKRYYCDYCDRSFIDEIGSRKKHLHSNNHLRNLKVHYDSCRDLAVLVDEESKKEECKRFRNTGYCPFENLCNFTHYSKEELLSFSYEVKKQKRSKVDDLKLPSVDDWLKQRNKSVNQSESFEITKPHFLQIYNFSILPPSLRPVSIEQMKNVHLESWGHAPVLVGVVLVWYYCMLIGGDLTKC